MTSCDTRSAYIHTHIHASPIKHIGKGMALPLNYSFPRCHFIRISIYVNARWRLLHKRYGRPRSYTRPYRYVHGCNPSHIPRRPATTVSGSSPFHPAASDWCLQSSLKNTIWICNISVRLRKRENFDLGFWDRWLLCRADLGSEFFKMGFKMAFDKFTSRT